MLNKYFKFLMLFGLLLSCNAPPNINDRTETATVGTPCPSVISSDTAAIIAKGYLFQDYNLEHYDFTVAEESNTWIVKFTGKGQINSGFGPTVFISKQDGNREYTVHSK